MSVPQQRRKWYCLQWFADHDTKEERRLILKLDLLIVPYAFLAYWTKYIDQANISMKIKTSLYPKKRSFSNFTVRQCLCIRSQRRPGFQWKRIGPTSDDVHDRRCSWAIAFCVFVHKATYALGHSVYGHCMGYIYLSAVPSKLLCRTCCISLLGRLVRGMWHV